MEEVFTPQFVQELFRQAPGLGVMAWLFWTQLRQHDRHIRGLIGAVKALTGRVRHVEQRLGIAPPAPAPGRAPVPPTPEASCPSTRPPSSSGSA
jgi:hypothetical protein